MSRSLAVVSLLGVTVSGCWSGRRRGPDAPANARTGRPARSDRTRPCRPTRARRLLRARQARDAVVRISRGWTSGH